MEKRILGRTNHMSTVAVFGAAAFFEVTQAEADKAMRQVIKVGVNHIDVAPSYGLAEKRLRPWLEKEGDRFFLGCKTGKRTRAEAAAELRQSLERLGVDSFDLYQLHAVGSMDELDKVTQSGGALEAVLDARQEGLTRFIGITGHGMEAPAVFLEALRRFDFDTVLFPLNFILFGNTAYRRNAEALLHLCRERNVGVMVIKVTGKRPWGDRPRSYSSWYEPFEDPEMIQNAVNFALSHDVTGLCTLADITLLPLVLEACEHYAPLERAQQEALIASEGEYELIFDGTKLLLPRG
jgi:aryl-alcohol dehydrogenase-like predicted oxidoreductase